MVPFLSEAVEASLCVTFLKTGQKMQMPKPQECTDTFILTKKLLLVGLRGLQNIYSSFFQFDALILKMYLKIETHLVIQLAGESLA